MAAASKGHVDIVTVLIEAKAQVNTQSKVKLLPRPETHYTTHTIALLLESEQVQT